MRRFPGCIWVAALLAIGTGCQMRVGGSSTLEDENDRLRQADAELHAELERMKARLGATEAENDILRRQKAGVAGSETPVVVPVATSIELDGFSGPFAAEGQPPMLRLYIRTLDQSGRMLPVTGRAIVQLLADEGVLATRQWDATAFAATYRSNFTGTHFTLEMPIPPHQGPLTVRVVVEDLVTGQRLRTEKTYPQKK